jgi:hypothetical protein
MPDASGPESGTLTPIRDQQVAVGSLEKQIGVTAREQPRRRLMHAAAWGEPVSTSVGARTRR